MKDGDWRGLVVGVIGSGPSAQNLRGPLPVDKVIAASRAGLTAHESIRVDAWVSIDWTFWAKKPSRPDNPIRVGLIEPSLKRSLVDIAVPRIGGHWEHVWSEHLEDGLGRAGHSGYMALNLAYVLGARDVMTWGLDAVRTPGDRVPSESACEQWKLSTAFALDKIRSRIDPPTS